MTRRAAVQRAVIEHLIVGDDPQAWRLAWVLTEDLYGTPVTKRQHATVWHALHRLHDEGIVQFRRHGPAQHEIMVRLDPAYREAREWMITQSESLALPPGK